MAATAARWAPGLARPRFTARSGLGEAEEIAGVVGKDRGDAPGLLLGRALELHAPRLQHVVRRGAVAGLEDSPAEDALLHQRAELRGGLLVEHHAGLRLHQRDLQLGLAGNADRDPAEIAHLRVGAHFEAELLG